MNSFHSNLLARALVALIAAQLASSVALADDVELRFERHAPDDLKESAVYKLRMTPAAEPDPALRYTLWPEFSRRKPGDAVPFYYRAILSYVQSSQENRATWTRQFGDDFENEWLAAPLAKLPTAEVRGVVERYRAMFAELQFATSLERCNWDLRLQDLEGFTPLLLILDEVQQTRGMARILALRARLQIASGDFDAAIATLGVGYKFAHDVAEPLTLVNDLVGIGIVSMLNDVLAELMTSRGAPNLYWAIAGLPRPLIDMRPALELERALPLKIFSFLKDAESVDRSPEEWRRLTADLYAAVDDFEGPRSQAEWLVSAMILRGYPRAKRELIAWGFAPDKVEAMAVMQVMAIHEARILRHISHEMFKWSLLPPHEGLPGLQASMAALRRDRYLGDMLHSKEIIPIGGKFLPALDNGMFASARVEREFAALRVVETLRMHAARNGGWPKSLGEVSLVPVPGDPVTGKPFQYRLEGETATIEAPPLEPGRFRGARYEVTLEAKP